MWTLISTFLVISVVTVVVVVVYMCFVSAERNGWGHLARHYRDAASFGGQRLHLRSAILNGFAFQKTLGLGVAEDGLFLQPAVPLRPFHPPLRLPWTDLVGKNFARTYSRGLEISLRPGGPSEPSPPASASSSGAHGPGDDDRCLLELELSEDLGQELAALLDPSWTAAVAVLQPRAHL